MHPRFNSSFDTEVRNLVSREPFKWIAAMIHDVCGERLDGTGVVLRSDGLLFLLVNCAYLIVMPWSDATRSDFRTSHASELSDDLADIVDRAVAIAKERNSVALSANVLLEATATRENGMRTRGLDIWGPP